MQGQEQATSSRPGIPVFPYYIDEEMTTSFLATIEGGISTAERISQTIGTSKLGNLEGEAEASGSVPLFGKARARGSIGRSSGVTTGEQWEWERQHTLISSFNVLRDQLYERGFVKSILQDPSVGLKIGDIVEFEGSIRENPFLELKELFETYFKMKPFLENQGTNQRPATGGRHTQKSQQANRGSKAGQSITAEEAMGKAMVDLGATSFEETGLLDIHVATGHNTLSSAVVTLRADQRPSQSIAYSKGSRCTVIGKVTGHVEEGETIKMYRRSGLRMFPSSTFVGIIESMSQLPGLEIDLGQVAISGPAIQVLPLAIFV